MNIPGIIALCVAAACTTGVCNSDAVEDQGIMVDPNTVEEVFLEPAHIDGNTYEYIDAENGIVVTMVPNDIATNAETDSDPVVVVENDVDEVYLEPIQTGENTYEYRDENGALIATLTTANDDGIDAMSVNKTTRTINWYANANTIVRSSNSIDATSGLISIEYDIDISPSGSSRLGHYHEGAEKYFWYDGLSTSGFNGTLTISSSHPIYLAIKNESSSRLHYTGNYSF